METEKLIKELGERFTQLKSQNDWLANENRRLKSEHYKDEELAKLKSENEQLRKGFHISPEEEQKIKKWLGTHECTCRGITKGRVSSFRFDIIPSIGYNGYVKCTCGKEFCFYEE